MINWADKETFWLNITNAFLGLVTIIAFAAVFGGAVVELFERAWKRVKVSVSGTDPHTLHVPELGHTMADGGEKRTEEHKAEEKPPRLGRYEVTKTDTMEPED